MKDTFCSESLTEEAPAPTTRAGVGVPIPRFRWRAGGRVPTQSLADCHIPAFRSQSEPEQDVHWALSHLNINISNNARAFYFVWKW